MNVSNERIKQLIRNRDDKISYFNNEIKKEIEKERAKRKFCWKRFALLLFILIMPFVFLKINVKVFQNDSIWSWSHYIK